MASITFTDGTGTATLNSGWPSPANRFRSYTPDVAPKQDVAHGLGTGRRYAWDYAADIYTATLELPGIVRTDLDIALRLKAHLLSGGLVTLTTNDASSNVYTNVGLAEGSEVTIELEDRAMIEYTFKATFVSQAATPVMLLCEYA
jgi:hypothetical protein